MENDWRMKAECLDADPEIFFPERGQNGVSAMRICKRCPVIEECLQYALDNQIDEGVWGGTSGYQRQRVIRKAMRTAA